MDGTAPPGRDEDVSAELALVITAAYGTVKVSEGWQITLPPALREAWGLKPGDHLPVMADVEQRIGVFAAPPGTERWGALIRR